MSTEKSQICAITRFTVLRAASNGTTGKWRRAALILPLACSSAGL